MSCRATGRTEVLLLCFCLVLVSVPHAQEKSNANQIDEFYDLNCEAQRSRVDLLLKELRDSPESKGIVVIHIGKYDPIAAYKQKSIITNHLKFRRFDSSRITFVRGKTEPRLRTELWKVATDEVDRFKGEPWNFDLTNLESSALVHSDSWIDGIGCGFAFSLRFFAEFLANNDHLVGRITVRDKSIGNYNRRKLKIANELVSTFKIPAKQLEFAFVQSDWSDVEYWYLPSGLFSRP